MFFMKAIGVVLSVLLEIGFAVGLLFFLTGIIYLLIKII